ncbi:MAG: SAM hydroxide adenosyltransferase [bacterium]
MNRQVVRAATLFPGVQISPVAVGNYADLEASGVLIDTLDAAMGKPGIIFANVAPRHGKAKKWENGTPFGHIQIGETHIFTTVDGFTLSLISKYGLADSIEVYDLPTVIKSQIKNGKLEKNLESDIINTQFRSYEFLPRVAKWCLDGDKLPFEKHALSDFLSSPIAIWYIDNFGNCKTTAWSTDFTHVPGTKVKTKWGEVKCYARLKDVPNGETGLIIGSSGLGDRRFIELVVQGHSAAAHFGAQVGDSLFD